MNFSFPSTVVVTRDAQNLLRSLEQAESSANQEGGSEDTQVVALVAANQTLYEHKGAKGLAVALAETLKIAPVFELILATHPHDSFLQEIIGWFRREIDPNCLLKISVRQTIGGGVIVRSKNRIFDFSLRPKILASKSKLPEVWRRV